MSTPLSARRVKSSHRPRSQHPPGKPTTCSNSSRSEAGDPYRATSEGVTSKTENDVFHEATIESMMSIQRFEGRGRDAERIVIEQRTGKAYYTGDHYRTFVPLN